MSEQTPLEPLDPELGALFDAERRFPAEPAAAEARVWKAVAAALVVPAAAGIGAATLGPQGWVSAVKSFGAAKLAALGTAVFVAGGVTGAAVQHVLIEPAVRDVPAQHAPPVPAVKPQPAPEPAVPAPVDPAPELPAPVPVEAPARRAPAPRAQPEQAPPAEPASLLAREQAIIDAARAALTAGHAGQALAALERHASEFATGHLVEEREGLRVLALVRAGRKDEATESAARFRAAYPRSVLLPAIDAALAASP